MNLRAARNVSWLICFLLTLVLSWQLASHFASASWSQVLNLIQTIPLGLGLILALCTVCFYLLDWLRFRSLLSLFGFRLRVWQGLRLTCVSYFVTCLTPLAELHTPAMVYLLHRQGLPVGQALAASASKSIYMSLWICLASYIALLIDHLTGPSILLPPMLRNSLPVLALPLLGLAVLLAGMAFFPAPVQRLTHLLAQAPQSVFQALLQGLHSSASAIGQIGRSASWPHLLCHLASISFLLLYVVQGYLLAQFFGFALSPWQAFTIFSTSLMIAYLAPTPGAIGVTELLTAYMLDPQLAAPSLAVALTLRLLCWYLVVPAGGLILAFQGFSRNK